MMKSAVLIYPPIDKSYYMVGVNDCPPMGLAVLQEYVQRKLNKKIKIDIFDGEHYETDEIIKIIKMSDYELIGIQPMMASYNNSIKILQATKVKGIITVLGGHHATQLYKSILLNRHQIIDYIVLGDGEEAFLQLIKGKPINEIPNIAYFKDGNLQTTNQINVNINDSYILNYSKQILSQYKMHEKYERRSQKSFRAFSHKGCKNRQNSQYCFFCGRADKGFRFKTPELYLEEINYLVNVCGADYIFEIGDDFLQDHDWLQELRKIKNLKYKNLKVNFKIFARANRVTEDIVPILKDLNINEVAIGFESGCEKILAKINKNTTTQDNINAAKLLFSNGIDTIASYVLGLPGETTESLNKTYDQALYIKELALKYLKKKPQEIIGNLIEINPGSAAFKLLLKNFPTKYENNDLLSVKETQDDYFKVVFNLRSEEEITSFRHELADFAQKLNSLGQYTYPAGWTKGAFL